MVIIRNFVLFFISQFHLDSLENIEYFSNIEKILSSIGISISDALKSFFNSDGLKNKDVCSMSIYRIYIYVLIDFPL